jgi:hypothetical protein
VKNLSGLHDVTKEKRGALKNGALYSSTREYLSFELEFFNQQLD